MKMKDRQKEERLYTWISLGLRSGVFVALGLVVIGLVMLVLSESKVADAVIPLNELPQRILNPDAKVVSSLGIAILLLTPILQVVIASVRFAVDRDRLYLGICLVLLCVLAFSLFLSVV